MPYSLKAICDQEKGELRHIASRETNEPFQVLQAPISQYVLSSCEEYNI
jgi:hypothetical protein